MAHYDVKTGLMSHRHPFRGFGQAVPSNGQSAAAVPVITPTPSPTVSKIPWGSSVLSGGIMGLVTYGTCVGFEVPSGKAAGIGVAVGLMTMVGQIASSLLKGWADDVAAQQQVTVEPISSTTPSLSGR